ncbi:MAG: hypothetical protein WC942_02445 [Clostridia bacterium]|jgi:hypothetical protein
MKFTGTFTTATIDLTKTERMIKEYLDTKIKEAASAWLDGVSGQVPVWSGMSQGSLLELVELIGGTLVITPSGNAPNRILRGKNQGSAILNTDWADYSITIITDVAHYNLQEYTNVGVSKSAPWHSLKAGKELAKSEMEKVSLPIPLLKIRRDGL